MQIHRTAIPEVLVIEPKVHSDFRGYLFEAFHRDKFAAEGLPTDFPQENQARSLRNVIRAFHYQRTRPQGKLMSVTAGRILDVAVDIRVGSPTFGKHVAIELDVETPQMLWVPPGFAHGFEVLSDFADVTFRCTDTFDPSGQVGIRWNDPAIGVAWRLESEPILAEPDRSHPLLRDAALPRYQAR